MYILKRAKVCSYRDSILLENVESEAGISSPQAGENFNSIGVSRVKEGPWSRTARQAGSRNG